MVDATPLIEPFAQTMNYLMNLIKLLVGGLFGLYVISFIQGIISRRKLNKKIDMIMEEIQELREEVKRIKRKE